MSNIPKMGQLPTPVFWVIDLTNIFSGDYGNHWTSTYHLHPFWLERCQPRLKTIISFPMNFDTWGSKIPNFQTHPDEIIYLLYNVIYIYSTVHTSTIIYFISHEIPVETRSLAPNLPYLSCARKLMRGCRCWFLWMTSDTTSWPNGNANPARSAFFIGEGKWSWIIHHFNPF